MGLERRITFAELPTWETLRSRLAIAGHQLQMRMIDNMPAFPDEVPDAGWKEVRFSLGHGMLTLRRDGATLGVIVWGNADAALQQDQAAVVNVLEALAQA
jgi:hypothetical protein